MPAGRPGSGGRGPAHVPVVSSALSAVEIFSIGDSLTALMMGRPGLATYAAGKTRGVSFIGPVVDGTTGLGHDGKGGWTSSNHIDPTHIAGGSTINDQLQYLLSTGGYQRANVCMLDLGTNDSLGNNVDAFTDGTIANVNTIMDMFVAACTSTTNPAFLVHDLLECNDVSEGQRARFTSSLSALVASRNAAGGRCVFCPSNAIVGSWNLTKFADNLHPTSTTGGTYDTIWIPGILPYLDAAIALVP